MKLDAGRFLLLCSVDNDEENNGYSEEFYYVPCIELDESSDVALQLVRWLHSYGLALRSYRELVRQTIVHYSFVDDTSGTKEDIVCIHALVERATEFRSRRSVAQFASFEEIQEHLGSIPLAVQRGMASLLAERNECFSE